MSLLDTAGTAAPAAKPDSAGTPATPPATPNVSGEGGAPLTPPSGDWYYDNNIKGDGAKPDWWKSDKYKTIADQAKAYSEVEKKLGAFKGAPEKYDLTIKDYPDLKFSEDDPLLKDFIENAKKNGVSQEYVSELLGVYAQALTYNMPDPEKEMQKIGVNAQQDLQILSQWAGNILSPEEFGMFKNMVTTADAFKVFEKLRNAGTGSDVAPPNNPHQAHETVDQVRAMISDPRYDTDENFRNEVRRKMSVALAKEGKKS